MPEPDSLEVTRLIRQISQVPIMILSVRDETADKLTALDMGADDYITKPFGIEGLLARTRAILRRTAPAAKEEFIPSTWNYRTRGLFVDLDGLRVISHDCGKQLTPREWACCGCSSTAPGESSRHGLCCRKPGGRTTAKRVTTSGPTLTVYAAR